MAGGGHWMVGDLVRRGSSEAASLAGRYEVEGGPTAAQRNGAKPAELILARNAYYLWDGCNHTEGLAIAFERQLFLHGSGLTTLANCLPERDRPPPQASSCPSRGSAASRAACCSRPRPAPSAFAAREMLRLAVAASQRGSPPECASLFWAIRRHPGDPAWQRLPPDPALRRHRRALAGSPA
jgi:hypothetical protein